jgi:hypothetical protein
MGRGISIRKHIDTPYEEVFTLDASSWPKTWLTQSPRGYSSSQSISLAGSLEIGDLVCGARCRRALASTLAAPSSSKGDLLCQTSLELSQTGLLACLDANLPAIVAAADSMAPVERNTTSASRVLHTGEDFPKRSRPSPWALALLVICTVGWCTNELFAWYWVV